jgi:hypothetical protein
MQEHPVNEMNCIQTGHVMVEKNCVQAFHMNDPQPYAQITDFLRAG